MAINLTIPTSWNDLTANQVKKIAGILSNNTSGKKLDLLVFLTLLNLKWYQVKKWFQVIWVLKQVPLSKLKEHFSFIYTQTDLTNFIPMIRCGDHLYFSPAKRMHDITINEFATADDLYLQYAQTKEVEYLRYLTAVLYYEIDSRGDKIPFNKSTLDKKVQHFAKLNRHTLLAIGLIYHGCRNEIVSKYTVVFPKKNTLSAAKQKKVQTSGLGNLISALTDGKIYHLETVKNTNVHDFLSDYQNKLIQLKQQKLKSHAR